MVYGKCGTDVAGCQQTEKMDILMVKKEIKLSASEITEVDNAKGKGCSSAVVCLVRVHWSKGSLVQKVMVQGCASYGQQTYGYCDGQFYGEYWYPKPSLLLVTGFCAGSGWPEYGEYTSTSTNSGGAIAVAILGLVPDQRYGRYLPPWALVYLQLPSLLSGCQYSP